ncbi:MAG: hypothetical protein IKP81_06955 [Paludibacteraceae bacterium]|nr:hypothetical protein [Paludibacteraceae bacterium]
MAGAESVADYCALRSERAGCVCQAGSSRRSGSYGSQCRRRTCQCHLSA